jgi:hypothetical protein
VLPVLTLSGIPLATLAPRTCGVCPVTCPMHARAQAAKLGCHRVSTPGLAARAHAHCAAGLGLTRPGCRGGHENATLSLAKAVMPAWSSGTPPTGEGGPAPDLARRPLRAADAPESPPPIVS